MKNVWRWPFVRRPEPVTEESAMTTISSADNASPPRESVASPLQAASVTQHNSSSSTQSSPSTVQVSGAKRRLPLSLPKPALRWVGEGSRIALREFDFGRDADAVCSWQQETYSLNFPDFRYTDGFASAFRHDLRRGALDPNHSIFVLDDGSAIGFLWLVICENTWTGERYGYVNNVYLVPSQRGQGLAREMMSHAERWFRSRGINRARLTVTSSNAIACRLYEECGYKTTRWEMEKEL